MLPDGCSIFILNANLFQKSIFLKVSYMIKIERYIFFFIKIINNLSKTLNV